MMQVTAKGCFSMSDHEVPRLPGILGLVQKPYNPYFTIRQAVILTLQPLVSRHNLPYQIPTKESPFHCKPYYSHQPTIIIRSSRRIIKTNNQPPSGLFCINARGQPPLWLHSCTYICILVQTSFCGVLALLIRLKRYEKFDSLSKRHSFLMEFGLIAEIYSFLI